MDITQDEINRIITNSTVIAEENKALRTCIEQAEALIEKVEESVHIGKAAIYYKGYVLLNIYNNNSTT